jgi:hypothetical protein
MIENIAYAVEGDAGWYTEDIESKTNEPEKRHGS